MIRHRFERGLYVRELEAEGTAGTLVWVHGLGESGLCFEDLMEEPRLRRWRHLAPDMPGYGKTPWRDEPLGLEEHGAFLADWILASNPDRPLGRAKTVVAGHSMGGVIGTFLCGRLGGRVSGFLNVEGNISLSDCGFSSQAAAFSLEEFRTGELGRMLDKLYRDGVNDEPLRTYYPSMRICDPAAYHRNSVELVELSRSEGLAERMAALDVPSLYVLGDPRGTGEPSRRLLDRAGVSWRAVEGTGHWPFLERPEAFLDVVVPFLEAIESV